MLLHSLQHFVQLVTHSILDQTYYSWKKCCGACNRTKTLTIGPGLLPEQNVVVTVTGPNNTLTIITTTFCSGSKSGPIMSVFGPVTGTTTFCSGSRSAPIVTCYSHYNILVLLHSLQHFVQVVGLVQY